MLFVVAVCICSTFSIQLRMYLYFVIPTACTNMYSFVILMQNYISLFHRPDECLSVQQAVDLYTTAGAFTARREHDLGQLLPGYFADFVILEPGCDPVQDPKLFLTAKVQQVWVAGVRKF